MNLLLAILVGLGLSILVERFLAPRPPGRTRAKGAWPLHIGLWLLAFTGALVVLQRPWFAMLLLSAFLMLIVVISNAKFKSLAEPFTIQDFRYLRDAIRYPRLYLPFLGWHKTLAVIVAVGLAVLVGLWFEPVLPGGLLAMPVAVLLSLCSIVGLLLFGNRLLPDPSLDPAVDLEHLGLLGSLWAYGRALKQPLGSSDGFDALLQSSAILKHRPHLVALQSESFCDPRDLLPGIRKDILVAFDASKEKARGFGRLTVPALGANTVRSEFGFLAGIDESALGAHKFNPYEAVLKGWQVETFPKILKRLGYRTVCIHPYVSGFYRRDRVFPMLGIDEFIDLSAFHDAERAGHYVSDAAVTDKILEVLATAQKPTFVFVITMENHGPLHLETLEPDETMALYDQAPQPGLEDLSVYLRHLKNADQMVARLTSAFDLMPTPVSLCWYGDHVPIMPSVYDRLKYWPKDSDYLIWDNWSKPNVQPGFELPPHPLAVHQLARAWLVAA